MNKNTLIGIVLIGLILIGFSWFNTRQQKEAMESKRIQDSIATQRAYEYAEELARKKIDSLKSLGINPDSLFAAQSAEVSSLKESSQISKEQYSSTYSNTFLENAHKGTDEYYTLENGKLKVVYTTRGAQAYSVLVKDYYTYDSLDLFLVRENASTMGIQFFSEQNLNTKDFTFTTVANNDSTLVMRLYFSDNSYLEHSYFLPSDSYMIDFNVKLVGMDKFIPRNMTQFDIAWNLDLPRLEKGYENEKNYSSVLYKYPDDDEVETLGLRKEKSDKSITTKFQWLAFQQQFFSAILLAENNFSGGELAYKLFPETDSQKRLLGCSSSAQFPYSPAAEGDEVSVAFKFYYGPNHFKTLKSYDYGFEKIVPLGGWLVRWINRLIIIPLFDFLSRYILNFGIIILIMTILLKIVISPLTMKSYMSSAKMRVLKPEIDKINAKYPKQDDAMKKQQETMELYKKSGVSMFGGCLPMLIQFPILFAMFRFFPASFELRQQGFLWAQDLSSYDSILDLPFKIPLYGDHVSLFAILMAVTMFFYSKMTAADQAGNQQMAGMKFMTVYFMPLFMLVLCNNFSSGLSYYYMLSNLFTMLQTWIIRKYFVDEEKLYAKLKENSAKSSVKQKSKFQLRLEAAQKAQQEALKQQKRR